SVTPPRPLPSLFPYTTLFRSFAIKTEFAVVIVFNDPAVVQLRVFEQGAPPGQTHHGAKRVLVRWRHKDQSGWLTLLEYAQLHNRDRKSTRLNSSHVSISYAVF